MGYAEHSVLDASRMPIVTEKKPAVQMHVRFDPDLLADIKAIADRTNRPLNEVIDLLLKWAVGREKAELEMTGEEPAHVRRKKRED